MEPDADDVMGRALLKRRLWRWRAGAVIAVAVAVLFATSSSVPPGKGWSSAGKIVGPHLVRLDVRGMIGSDVSRWTKALDRAGQDSAVKGLVLAIDSPGGAVTGGEELHDAVEHFAQTKPVVATMGGMGASAGYMIAVPATRIFAERSTLTGSIGVLMEAPEFSGLLGRLGVNVQELVSGPLKGQPSLAKPVTPEGRVMLQGVVNDLFDQFVTMVVNGRHMPVEKVRQLADGRPYTGRQALAAGLIDEVGSARDAQVWLGKKVGLGDSPKIVRIGEAPKSFVVRHHILGWLGGIMMSWLGLDVSGIAPQLQVPIDGAVSIWKP